MSKTMKAKTLTATIQAEPLRVLALIANAETLSQWNPAFCRSVRKDGVAWIIDSPLGAVPARVLREDRAGLVDWVLSISGIDLHWSMRVLANGNGTEWVLTLIQPETLSDRAFHDHTRWAEKATRELKKLAEAQERQPSPAESVVASAPSEASSVLPEAEQSIPSSDGSTPLAGLDSKKLFIGNLPFDWKESHLREHFAAAGQIVTAEVATYGRSGRSRGFGFVEMSTEAETQAAITQLHGSVAGSRKIVVRISRPRENRPPLETPLNDAATVSSEIPAESVESPASTAKAPSEKKPLPRPNADIPRRGRREVQGRFASSRQQRERQAGVIATGEYEFFPRGQTVESAPSADNEPGNHREGSHSGSGIEASPYLEDTGDIENRGNRRPRPRTTRPGGPRRGLRPHRRPK